MSINPVTTLTNAAGTATANGRASRSSSSAKASSQPDSGTKPREEIRSPQRTTDSAEMSKDEVQVQRVDGASGQIVIKYVDSSGDLILQIPSSQVLGLARAVEQALQEQANRRIRANENAQLAKGENSDGS